MNASQIKCGGHENKNLIQDKNGQIIFPFLSEVFIRLAFLVKISHHFEFLCSFALLHFCKLVTVPPDDQVEFSRKNAYLLSNKIKIDESVMKCIFKKKKMRLNYFF